MFSNNKDQIVAFYYFVFSLFKQHNLKQQMSVKMSLSCPEKFELMSSQLRVYSPNL